MTATTYYLQQADVEDYIEGWVTDDADALARLMRRCELDVDTLLAGFGAPNDTSGLKYDPAADLQDWQSDALTRACCAQVEYRFAQGETFFVEGQYDSWQGPDFAAKGKLPYFGPKVSVELSRTGIARVPGVTSVSTSYLSSPVSRWGWLTNIRAN